MITKTEVAREPNLWEGIYFFPDAATENRFMATVIEGRKTKTIGLFSSLQEAVDERSRYIGNHTNMRTRETATFPKFETRPING